MKKINLTRLAIDILRILSSADSGYKLANDIRNKLPYIVEEWTWRRTVNGLCAANILQSKRGTGGGLCINKERKITALDVIEAVEPIDYIDELALAQKQYCKYLRKIVLC